MLGLGMDEADEDEDERITVKDVPFIAAKDFLLKYGKDYTAAFDENKQVMLTAVAG